MANAGGLALQHSSIQHAVFTLSVDFIQIIIDFYHVWVSILMPMYKFGRISLIYQAEPWPCSIYRWDTSRTTGAKNVYSWSCFLCLYFLRYNNYKCVSMLQKLLFFYVSVITFWIRWSKHLTRLTVQFYWILSHNFTDWKIIKCRQIWNWIPNLTSWFQLDSYIIIIITSLLFSMYYYFFSHSRARSHRYRRSGNGPALPAAPRPSAIHETFWRRAWTAATS